MIILVWNVIKDLDYISISLNVACKMDGSSNNKKHLNLSDNINYNDLQCQLYQKFIIIIITVKSN